MAVDRVFGRIDGTDIVFEKAEGGRWEIPVPYDADGQYIVEIVAEDDAGNQSYLAKMLWTVNTSLLCAHLEPVPYYAELLPGQYMTSLVDTKLTVEVCSGRLFVTLEPDRYMAELIEPQCSLEGG